MPIILPFADHVPRIDPRAWIADNAVIIGDVEIAAEASVWFGCVLRGDVGPIRIGPRSNVQDLSCLHTTGGLSQVVIGEDVTVGHHCVLHGCQIRDRALVGMGSVLLDNAVLGEEAVLGAGSVLTARTVVAPRMLAMGRPAKVVREATEAELRLGIDGAVVYLGLSKMYGPAAR
jgi:carbonic anhydrase/acetyltransferase-like protein (isoleucine patch superfamily)